MVFSSITFIFYFLPLVFLLYFILPYKNGILLFASLIFYSWGEPKYILLMLLTVFINYVAAMLMDRYRKHAHIYLYLALGFSLGALILFKYADFIIVSINSVIGSSLSPLKLGLPIGISFYTFQTLSYTVDVYRNDVSVQENYFTLLTYVSLFPQLIAGPIVRYADIESELETRTSSVSMIFEGITRFSVGLSKKVIIANTLAEIVSAFKLMETPSVLMGWLYALAFTLQLYYDFSGYSDMAIGLGKIFGFNFLENFNYPLISGSITDFWRRWHISLGGFFRDYVYIPLGGSRVSKGRWILNLLIVWSLTGLWHGAAWNFVFWGLLFAVLLIVEKIFELEKKDVHILQRLLVFIIIILSFVIFDTNSMHELQNTFRGLFINNILIDTPSLFYLRQFTPLIIVALLGATPYVRNMYTKILSRFSKESQSVITFVLTILGFIVSVLFLVDSSFNPFLYFRF